MRICSIDTEPFEVLTYWNADRRRNLVRAKLPFLRGTVTALPDGLDAIVAMADLQGREIAESGGPGELLGCAVASRLCKLAERGDLPPLENVGVFIAGDLYTVPNADRRGGTGDVMPVWQSFGALFRWVAGVAGNHDTFGNTGWSELEATDGTHPLDGNAVSVDGLRVAGVGGIVGKLTRNQRKASSMMLALIEKSLQTPLSVLLLHEGPRGPEPGQRGNPDISEFLEIAPFAYDHIAESPPLVICGHTYWHKPLVELKGGIQVLKVDARVVVLTV